MTTLLTLPLALALDALFSDPPNRFHPVVAMGVLIRWWVNRAPFLKDEGGRITDELRLFFYGTTLVLSGILIFTAPLAALEGLLRPRPWLAVAVNAVLLKTTFSLRRLLEAGREVEAALERNDLPEARRAVSWHLVSRDTTALDAGHVASATVESLAENLADSFVAPLLAFLVGGLPLAWAYRFVNTADAMIGYHDERHEYLGKFAARLDDALNWIPARLAGLFIVLAAPFVRGDTRGAWRVMLTQHGRPASPNAGWPMSATAGALGVRLEKIGYYRLEGGADLPTPATIARARQLILCASLLWSIACLLLVWSLTNVI